MIHIPCEWTKEKIVDDENGYGSIKKDIINKANGIRTE